MILDLFALIAFLLIIGIALHERLRRVPRQAPEWDRELQRLYTEGE